MKDKSINIKDSWNQMSTIFSEPLMNDGCHFLSTCSVPGAGINT